jgi:cbb3-type cytochrome oxidase subunit 3
MAFNDDITDSALAIGVVSFIVFCTLCSILVTWCQYNRRYQRREREDSNASLTGDF